MFLGKSMRVAAFSSACLIASAAFAKDAAGSRDHPLVGRYAGSTLTQYKFTDFDEQRLVNAPVDIRHDDEKFTDGNSVRLQGKVMRIWYDAPKDRSTLEIMSNYEESLRAKGFETLFSCANDDEAGRTKNRRVELVKR